MLAGMSPTRSQPVFATFWWLLKGGIGFGLALQASMSLAKPIMCVICSKYLRYIRPASFWILFGFVTMLILMPMYVVFVRLYQIYFPESDYQRPHVRYYGTVAKTTRSGAVYGYM